MVSISIYWFELNSDLGITSISESTILDFFCSTNFQINSLNKDYLKVFCKRSFVELFENKGRNFTTISSFHFIGNDLLKIKWFSFAKKSRFLNGRRLFFLGFTEDTLFELPCLENVNINECAFLEDENSLRTVDKDFTVKRNELFTLLKLIELGFPISDTFLRHVAVLSKSLARRYF